MTRLLDTYYDPALETDLELKPKQLAAHEIARLQGELALAIVAANWPRRLADASAFDLSLDKKRSRRIAHGLRQSLLAWGGKERKPSADETRLGGQVDWPLWAEEREARLVARLRYVSTWARATGEVKYGKGAVVRLSQELEWLQYAMRD